LIICRRRSKGASGSSRHQSRGWHNHTTTINAPPGSIVEVDLTQESDHQGKLEKILKGSLDSIPSPSPSVKTQIMGRKVCLRCKGKTLLGVVNKILKTKSLLTSPSKVLPYYL
jgi:hypothetical protein